jgi:hypothetical protein
MNSAATELILQIFKVYVLHMKQYSINNLFH